MNYLKIMITLIEGLLHKTIMQAPTLELFEQIMQLYDKKNLFCFAEGNTWEKTGTFNVIEIGWQLIVTIQLKNN